MTKRREFIAFFILVLVTGLVTFLSPVESLLGRKARLVYFHGAWVWASILAFVTAAGTGLAGLLGGGDRFHERSRAWGRVAIVYWLIFLPMALVVMQANWNGLFLSEPRWRIPLNLAVIGVFLQLGLSFFPLSWSSAGNLAYLVLFVLWMKDIGTVLHPESPVAASSSVAIKAAFAVLVLLLYAMAWLAAGWWQRRQR